MMLSFKPATRVIGLDIGRSSIKAVQLSMHDKGPRLDGCLRLQRRHPGKPLGEDDAQWMLRAMQRRGLTAANLVLVAPTDALVGGSINVPPADAGVSRDKIVEMELSRTHKLTPGSFEMAWWDLPVPASGYRISQAHAIALPHHSVEATLDTIAQVGLKVLRTVPGSLALLASAQRHPIDPRCISAVLDLGSTRGHLSMMYAGRIVHERALPDFNMQSLCQRAGEAFGVEREVATYALSRFGLGSSSEGMVACQTASILSEVMQPLAEEVGMSFAYVSHLYPEAELGHLLLAGGGANLVGLSEGLSQILELQSAVITPASLITSGGFGDECVDPALVVALGAALCGEVTA